MLTFENIRHQFGANLVLDNISFTVEKGSIFALLGTNGCGKTTLFNILLGLLKQTSGSISLNGERDPEVYRKHIGVLFDSPCLINHQSGLDNLKWIAHLKGASLTEAKELAEQLEISSALKMSVKKYSLGMKKRLCLVAALLGNPPLLLLDEPTNGLDVLNLITLRAVLQKYVEKGGTILIASHLMSELERTCSHVALLSKTKIQEIGTYDTVIGSYQSLEQLFIAKAEQSIR
jgi:ABC-type multidrug transport system ATPase subunit